jgi:hypothetical protein
MKEMKSKDYAMIIAALLLLALLASLNKSPGSSTQPK